MISPVCSPLRIEMLRPGHRIAVDKLPTATPVTPFTSRTRVDAGIADIRCPCLSSVFRSSEWIGWQVL